MTDAKGKVREFMHAHPDGDMERADGLRCFHVIERSAYDRCLAERDEARAEVERLKARLLDCFTRPNFDIYHQAIRNRDEQSALLDLAVAALEKVAGFNMATASHTQAYRDDILDLTAVAKDALTKIKKGRG